MARRLHSAQPLLHIPVIYVTSEPMDRVTGQAEALGAAHVLSKPFESGELLACIHETLERPGQHLGLTG